MDDDPILPALARILALHVAGIGHVYDQTPDDPTPDAITDSTDGLPQGIFIDPYQLKYDTDAQGGTVPTFGLAGITNDESTILFVLLHGVLDKTKAGTLQRKARPFARYRVRDAIRQHNSLRGADGQPTVWRAVAQSAKGGPFEWGGKTFYATQYTLNCTDERTVESDD